MRSRRTAMTTSPLLAMSPPTLEVPSRPVLADIVDRDRTHCCAGYGEHGVCVRAEAVAELPTRYGHFRVVAFRSGRQPLEHIALVRGEVAGATDVPTRIHSECLTGDALGSFRCDCRDQLEAALRELGSCDRGLLLYLRQEGRGIGLANKVRAYALQDSGLDTVDANLALGFREDERDYGIAAHMLVTLDVRSIRLMTNNPDKIAQLERHGLCVAARLPHLTPPNDHNRFYLATKATRCGHHLDAGDLVECRRTA
jgi:GTP cyclohydrolase II